MPTIIEMVAHTRLDCAVGSAALMRAVESEAATTLALRLAGAVDRAARGDAGGGPSARDDPHSVT